MMSSSNLTTTASCWVEHRAPPPCPLCAGGSVVRYHQDRRRDYYRCGGCALVFVPPSQHVSAAKAKAEYDRHQNRPEDTGYRRFLSRLFEPMRERLPAGAKGLDFGVRTSELAMPTFTNQPPISGNNTTDHRVRLDEAFAASR